uniref:Free methionine-R-sulfoxide reductase n=1 Tax=Talaromyces marneffei PM1 TaxID=1077442 RepID=A0A093VD58_TALMA
MPHADSSFFAAGASKEEVNLANVASLLWHAYASLPKPSSAVNWAGFYVRDDLFPLLASPKRSNSISGLTTTTISTSYASSHDKKLLLGPFQGKPACQEIRFGRGVCGTAAQKRETVVVPDVLEFPGHIACERIVGVRLWFLSCLMERTKKARKIYDFTFQCYVGSPLSTSTISSTWSAVLPDPPVPPWSTTNQQRYAIEATDQQLNKQQQESSFFDFSLFERDSQNSFSSSSSSSTSSPHSIPLSDHNTSPSLWSASHQVACAAPGLSLDQFTGVLDPDFFANPTSVVEQQGELFFDFPLDFGSGQGQAFSITTATTTSPELPTSKPTTSAPHITIVEDLSSTCSPANMSDGGSVLAPSVDIGNMNMDHFYSTPTTSVGSTTMSSIPSRDFHPLVTQFHQQHQQPLLAPKQYTPPSSSVSPTLSHIHSIDLDNTNSKSTKKRSRAESTGLSLSSNNSAQDSEEERIVEKRRRNTMAARRFRQRKQDHVSDLQSQLSKVTKERDDLKLQVAKWEGEVMALRKLLEMKK